MSQQSQEKANKSRQNASQRPGTSSQIVVDEDETLPASQISPNKNLTEQEHEHHVANVVKYLLAADYSNIPINKTLISKAVNCHNKNFKRVLTSAIAVLKDTFGYCVEEVDGKIFLTNSIRNDIPHLEYEEHVSTRYILLFLILAHIYMSGDHCNQDSLVNYLMALDIVTDGTLKSDTFGDIHELITEFSKEKYLQVEKAENGESSDSELKWGIRAELELSPRSVMEFVSKTYHGRAINTWPQQYKRMLEIEQKNAYKKETRLQNNMEEQMEE